MYQLPVCAADAPLVDVVFVHGIRGGAFATWRREGVLQHGQVGLVGYFVTPGVGVAVDSLVHAAILGRAPPPILQHEKTARQQAIKSLLIQVLSRLATAHLPCRPGRIWRGTHRGV